VERNVGPDMGNAGNQPVDAVEPSRIFDIDGLTDDEIERLDRDVVTCERMRLDELQGRLMTLRAAIKAMQRDDPRPIPAFYVAQQRIMNTVLGRRTKAARAKHGIPEPERVTVRLKPARLHPVARDVRAKR